MRTSTISPMRRVTRVTIAVRLTAPSATSTPLPFHVEFIRLTERRTS
jgi:hypothetical protein